MQGVHIVFFTGAWQSSDQRDRSRRSLVIAHGTTELVQVLPHWRAHAGHPTFLTPERIVEGRGGVEAPIKVGCFLKGGEECGNISGIQ